MAYQTENEKKALLVLFKDFTSYYNANTLSKLLNISRIGCMKLLKKLKEQNILLSKKIGKSIVYRPNMENDYAMDILSFCLAEEANNFKRWKDEFKPLFEEDRIILLYGSTIKDYSKARDIDLMIIRSANDSGKIHKTINEKQQSLPKKLHLIDLSPEEFLKNIEKKQEAIIDIVKNAVVLSGNVKYLELLKNVTSF